MTVAALDAIVVGAGVVGSALAHQLAVDGRRVLLVERDWSEPDRIVGELLQPGGVEALRTLGMDDCLEGIDAVRVDGYGVFHPTRAPVQLTYPQVPRDVLVARALNKSGCVDGCGDAGSHQYHGRSFHHGRFVMRLREKCLAHENIETVQATVVALLTDNRDGGSTVTGVRFRRSAAAVDKPAADETLCEEQVYAPLTFVADGCFSKFRRELAGSDDDSQSPCPSVEQRSTFVGAVLHDCPLPMPNHGHVVLADPSPILLYQIGTRDTRVLVDIPAHMKMPSVATGELQRHMLTHVLPQLPPQVQPAFRQAVKTQRLRTMPNSVLSASVNQRAGLIVLGDALNMRHPLTGGGMTVGLCDVVLLTDLLRPLTGFDECSAVMQCAHQFHSQRHAHSTSINVLAQALYGLYSAGDDDRLRVLRNACFTYFTFGGICVLHPISLLGGLLKSPAALYTQFFAVAFVGCGQLLATPVAPLDRLLIPSRVVAKVEQTDAFLALLYRLLNCVLWLLLVVSSLPVNLCLVAQTLYAATAVLLRSF